ncbi:MAG: dihydrolipoyl dehydrogenase, partial [Acidithiobacillus ferrooxidans]
LAEAQGIPLQTGRYDFEEDSRAQILERMEGGIQLFFAADSLRLLGGWVVGIDAGSLIGQIGTAAAHGLTAYDLARFADQHPMSAEGIGKAARSLF